MKDMPPITFLDGVQRVPTTMRTSHTLRLIGNAWIAQGIHATFVAATAFADGMWRVEIEGVPHFLRHDPDNNRYSSGGWPNAIPTAFVLRRCPGGAVRDGVILEVWDVEYRGHGADHIEGWMGDE